MTIRQGDTPRIFAGSDGFASPEDLTNMLADVRVTATAKGTVTASALAADLELKLDNGLANKLAKFIPAAGYLARIPSTGEYVLITAIDGTIATVTRAQPDPDAVASVAANIDAGSGIYVFPILNAPASALLDPADTSNQSAILRMAAADTRAALPIEYDEFQAVFQDGPGDIVTTWISPTGLTIMSDADGVGA